MKFTHKKVYYPALAPEPTIWALRKNTRAAAISTPEEHTLYEHLFGYDPISLVRRSPAETPDAAATSAQNPKLNILNSGTNFAVMELASDLEPEAS